MRPGRAQSGQASPEYLGLVLLVALIAAGLAAAGLGPGIASSVRDAFCRAVGAGCASVANAEAYGPAVPLADPKLSSPERSLLLAPDPQLASLEVPRLTAPELAWLRANDPQAFAAAVKVKSWTEQQELLDAVLDAELSEFGELKDSAAHDARMDWSDDGCSAPVVGSEQAWFHFREACERHDFGYRNAKRLGLFGGYKHRIDAVFAHDMYDACQEEAWWQRKPCEATAGAFYAAVRVAGGGRPPVGPLVRSLHHVEASP